MKMIYSSLLFFLLLGCTGKQVLPRDTMIINLNIANRDWDPDRKDKSVGWCAEACIQMAMAYYKKAVSQKDINNAASPSHSDIYMDEIDIALEKLSVGYNAWHGKNKNIEDFVIWIKAMLNSYYPVISGVKIYPTEHPEWYLDHFVLIIGYNSKGLLVNTNIQGQQLICFEQLNSYSKGFSFKNKHHRFYARAITGILSSSTKGQQNFKQ